MPTFRLSTVVYSLVLAAIAMPATAATEMRVFDGYASSRAVLAGRYANAIEIATDREATSIRFHRVVNATALCVALTKTGQLDAAEAACDRAVDNASELNFGLLQGAAGIAGLSAKEIRDVVAANRAVLQELSPLLTADR